MFDVGSGHEVSPSSSATGCSADDEARGLSDDGLCVGMRDSIAAQRAEDAKQMVLLAEMELRKTCETEFGLTTAGWLAQQAGSSRASAKARVKVANALRRHLDVTLERMVDGRVSFEQAK